MNNVAKFCIEIICILPALPDNVPVQSVISLAGIIIMASRMLWYFMFTGVNVPNRFSWFNSVIFWKDNWNRMSSAAAAAAGITSPTSTTPGGRKRTTQSSYKSEEQALDQIAKEVSLNYTQTLGTNVASLLRLHWSPVLSLWTKRCAAGRAHRLGMLLYEIMEIYYTQVYWARILGASEATEPQ